MRQRGFILFVTLVMLVIMSLLGISMFGGFTQDEMMSGNFREKHRAIDAAQTALNSAQYWISQSGNTYTGNWVTGTHCAAVSSAPVVCSNALANAASPPWTTYTPFTPTGMTVNASGAANTYATNVSYYIQYLGTTSVNPPTALYQVTATASGGNATAVTVVQAVYQVQASSRDIGGG
jgi:type IV pilus assembly protein PilX